MTTKEILIKARALIARPGGWKKGELEDSEGAVCAIGAISKAQGHKFAQYDRNDGRGNGQFAKAIQAVADVLPPLGATVSPENRVVTYNDRNSKKCVIAAFDAAIERTERAEK